MESRAIYEAIYTIASVKHLLDPSPQYTAKKEQSASGTCHSNYLTHRTKAPNYVAKATRVIGNNLLFTVTVPSQPEGRH